MIELINLTKKFDQFTAVDSVSLTIETGEFFGLLGPNGAGKTTTIGMMSTLLLPTQGEIRIDGELLNRHRTDLKRKISVITQEYSMRQDMTMDEIMEYQGRLYYMPLKEIRRKSEELLEFCKANPGKVTYPALPDFTGSAFVRNIIYEVCGWEQFQAMEPDYDTVKAAIEPALDYLRQLNPYLWNEGKTFPDSGTAVDAMFADGELVMAMSYSPFGVSTGIDKGIYTETTKTFVFDC